MPTVDASGTRQRPERVYTNGTRRYVYQQEEHLVMISRDKFDALESARGDKSLFSHLATGCLTFGLTLGAEMLVTYHFSKGPIAFSLVVVCGFAILFGLLFLSFAIAKSMGANRIKNTLFAEEKLIGDYTILNTEGGKSVTIDNLTSGLYQHQSHSDNE